MDISSISGLSGASYSQKAAEIGIEDSKVNSFKEELEKAKASGDDEQLREAARTFESYFLNMIFKQMRSTINYTGGIFERSTSEKLFQEMLDEEYADLTSRSGGIGLADAIYEQMKQE